MFWLTWKQHRMTMIIGVVVLIALSIVFVQDAALLNAALRQHHFVKCFDPNFISCGIMVIPGTTWQWRTLAATLLPLLPLVVGVFIGAPLLAREYEHRTQIFAWTQSISPARWLTSKATLLGGVVLLFFVGLSTITTWWGFIQDTIAFSPWDTFMIRGCVPVAYALFCLMCGIMIGSFVRRILPAMGLTLLFLLFMQGVITFGYPYLLPPTSQVDYDKVIRQQHLVGKFGVNSQDLIVSRSYVLPDGKSFLDLGEYCHITAIGPYNESIGRAYQQCINAHHIKPLVTYHRFSERFWPLQFVTTALLLALTVLAIVITRWQLRRRML